MRIEHVAMYVNDMEAAKDFFVKYFNAKTSEKYHNFRSGFSSYFLTFDDERSAQGNLPHGLSPHSDLRGRRLVG